MTFGSFANDSDLYRYEMSHDEPDEPEVACPECLGDGKVIEAWPAADPWSYEDYEEVSVTCSVCNGTGKITKAAYLALVSQRPDFSAWFLG